MKAAHPLLDQYAGLYAEVARLKAAIKDGGLPMYFERGEGSADLTGNDFAAMVSSRLRNRLLALRRVSQREGTQAEISVSHIGLYVMAAQADELFLLGLDWPGAQPWQDYLLERALFNTSTAGRDFFVHLNRLIASRAREPLHEELGTVFLMALQLGFKGRYRGREDESRSLRHERQRLLQFIGLGHELQRKQPAFGQAYRHNLHGTEDQRIGPHGRWRKLSWAALAAYLVISTAAWLHTVNPNFNGTEGQAQSAPTPVEPLGQPPPRA